MRIVDVNEFYAPTGGGVRTYLDRKIQIMAAMGHEQIVIAPGREDWIDERPGGGRVIYVKAPRLPFDRNYGLFWSAEPIVRLLDSLQPDVVENCSPWRSAWIVGRWRGAALKSYFMHNDNVEAYPDRWFGRFVARDRIERAFAWYDRYMNRALANFDTVVTNGPHLTERLTARGVRVDATMTLGVERSHFSPALRDERLRASLLEQCDLPADALLLIGIGRHHPEKHWPTVIDAVTRAGATQPVGLIVFGHGFDTRRLTRHIGGGPHVRLFRPVYDRGRLATILASADAFIHGNYSEPFGLVAAEALASGLPLIVPNEGGASAIADPLFAETYRPRDAYDCSDAILRLMARDRVLLRRAATVAAGQVRSDEQHVASLMAHYAQAIATRDAAPAAVKKSA